jgi:predicted glycoside hydrolase/deacetylase ChbG (UPF0249 family)
MANGAAFDDALRWSREAPALDIGCHLVLVGGESLVSGKPLPATVTELLKALARRSIEPYEELAAQVRRIVAAGVRPSHLDTHKHTHLAPPVLDAVARISQEFGIPWVRRPFDFPLNALGGVVPYVKRLTSSGLGLLRRHFHTVLTQHGCKTTDHFAGFQITGALRTAELVALMDLIPPGSTELMCHPGICGAALLGARTRLKESREAELAALVAPEVRSAVERNGIELVTYAQLPPAAR